MQFVIYKVNNQNNKNSKLIIVNQKIILKIKFGKNIKIIKKISKIQKFKNK